MSIHWKGRPHHYFPRIQPQVRRSRSGSSIKSARWSRRQKAISKARQLLEVFGWKSPTAEAASIISTNQSHGASALRKNQALPLKPAPLGHSLYYEKPNVPRVPDDLSLRLQGRNIGEAPNAKDDREHPSRHAVPGRRADNRSYWQTIESFNSHPKLRGSIATPLETVVASANSSAPPASRTSSQRRALSRFTREIELYLQATKFLPNQKLIPSPSTTTVSAHTVEGLRPFHAQFQAAGLAVTSAEQRRKSQLGQTVAPRSPVSSHGTRVLGLDEICSGPMASEGQREKSFLNQAFTAPRQPLSSQRSLGLALDGPTLSKKAPSPKSRSLKERNWDRIYSSLEDRHMSRSRKQKKPSTPASDSTASTIIGFTLPYEKHLPLEQMSQKQSAPSSDRTEIGRTPPHEKFIPPTSHEPEFRSYTVDRVEKNGEVLVLHTHSPVPESHVRKLSSTQSSPIQQPPQQQYSIAELPKQQQSEDQPRENQCLAQEHSIQPAAPASLYRKQSKGQPQNTFKEALENQAEPKASPRKSLPWLRNQVLLEDRMPTAPRPTYMDNATQTSLPSKTLGIKICKHVVPTQVGRTRKTALVKNTDQQAPQPDWKNVSSSSVKAKKIEKALPGPLSIDRSSASEHSKSSNILNASLAAPQTDNVANEIETCLPSKESSTEVMVPAPVAQLPSVSGANSAKNSTRVSTREASTATISPTLLEQSSRRRAPVSSTLTASPATSRDFSSPSRVSDKQIIRGLYVATAAACDEDVDKWIEEVNGCGVRKMLADLSAFEGLGFRVLADVARRAAKQRRAQLGELEASREERLPGDKERDKHAGSDTGGHMERKMGLVAREASENLKRI